MVFDTKSGCIYLLGRLGDGDVMPVRPEDEEALRRAGERVGPRESTAYCSEFYRYHTRGLDVGKWDLLSFDTAVSHVLHLAAAMNATLTRMTRPRGVHP